MLTELSIRDFAIIDEVSITFNEGLTVLTGETGAGKSIIIDAVQLLAGGRGSIDYVRHGAKKAEIEGLFTIDNKNHPIYHVGSQYGIEIPGEQLVLQRTITANGKSICRVNSKLVTLAILKEFGKKLIDIHSQHETQSLMDPENHIELLDMYDPEPISKAKEEYTDLFNKLSSLKARYKKFSENEQEMAHRLDLLQFQMKELEQANLVPNEDDDLEEERTSLANYEKIHHALQDAYNALYGEQKGLEWLNQAQLALQDSSSYDPFIAQKAEEVSSNYFVLEELTYDLRNHIESLQYSPDRLNEIESRLNEINRLKKKYGATVNDILEYMAKIEEEIEEITNKDSHLSHLAQQINETAKDVYLEAKQLHDIRRKASESLMKAIHEELKELYLEKASFSISFDHKQNEQAIHDDDYMSIDLHKNGFDRIRFLISTNTGEPLKPLNKVASGGELSRIMLVLKNIFAKHQGVTSVIFDEVDTGVSGRVAQAMAEKIFQISSDSQVLCITHLPQVAAMADTHKFIEKREGKNRTATIVSELPMEDQVEELSRMITGTELTDTAKEHGRELLDLASIFKKNKDKNNKKSRY
ncbi:DNA repair protein RecN (Recombination protein N) [Virgibacillus natechei]|uniref:DNA repair protein RecN n=1 Tax=Virgibacillus natechei TaxID=1216297 RepID=A0ABS4IGZ0_9BACI|nr:DNA repair protein RecN [Virgibacillus natechei]MBP1969701.1 DNA repair protein RecN (Recombination protein N) [Virgibacillus natechei]UZD11426.1 DNA repair protein RecN [Virgibacillus natechei]